MLCLNPFLIFFLFMPHHETKFTSRLEIINLKDNSRQIIYETSDHIEAPNWTIDGKWILFNNQGCIYKIPSNGGKPEKINTGFAEHCNNDHLLSPDNKQIAISDSGSSGSSRIYILPFAGGTPKLITENGPSYLHGWSPDGKTLAYCAERNGQFDIYAISVEGGSETRLTDVPGLDDGPEYSPEGKYIYFNSDRTGLMQIYRMKPDGSEQEQLTFDAANNWFPHISPNGKTIIFLTYDRDVKGHPANKDVRLRTMPYPGGSITTLISLFGGQGTINVPSWSADNQRVAFVSYKIE
jgi:TolB protein